MALTTCTQCNGTGLTGDPKNPGGSLPCDQCRGTGQKDLDWIGDLQEKGRLNAEAIAAQDVEIANIKAEQLSQRVDLTAILTQIWNKVKDL